MVLEDGREVEKKQDQNSSFLVSEEGLEIGKTMVLWAQFSAQALSLTPLLMEPVSPFKAEKQAKLNLLSSLP